MNEILGQLDRNSRLKRDAGSLIQTLHENLNHDIVLFWFHPLCPACSDLIEMWYQHNDTNGFLRAGNVLFVEFSVCIQKAFGITVLPSITVLTPPHHLAPQRPNMFGTTHVVATHCNTSFGGVPDRFGVQLVYK